MRVSVQAPTLILPKFEGFVKQNWVPATQITGAARRVEKGRVRACARRKGNGVAIREIVRPFQ